MSGKAGDKSHEPTAAERKPTFSCVDWDALIDKQRKRAANFEDRNQQGRAALLKLRRMITENEALFLSALKDDLGKSKLEAYASEIAVTLNEIDFLIRKQHRMLKDRRVQMRPGTGAYISRRPYGSVLIMSPWNYPFQLALLPLAGALAAGNGCFLKPSELSPATSGLIARLAEVYFSPEEVVVVEGDGATASALLAQKWDFIFFTGSERIGGMIAVRAAELRIPSILELGGKCPCIVDASSVNAITARRIIWGKFINAGQTCVAPDHILVEASAAPKLIEELKKQLFELYGENPELSNDYGHIIGIRHFARLQAMLKAGKIVHGGKCFPENLYMEPSIIVEPRMDSPLMQEEIFGPILPILTWSDKEELLKNLCARPEPLAVYAFCKDKELARRLDNDLRSGAFCLNHVLEHVARVELPFGGVGNSGYGRYHGKASFEAFTFQKIIYRKSQKYDFRLRYPPYQDSFLSVIRRMRKWLP